MNEYHPTCPGCGVLLTDGAKHVNACFWAPVPENVLRVALELATAGFGPLDL